MNITIQSIHFDASDQLNAYIERKCNKLDQFFNRIIRGEVFLKVTKPASVNNKMVEIKVEVPGDVLIASETADTFEAATDLATAKLKGQLTKYKEKLKSH